MPSFLQTTLRSITINNSLTCFIHDVNFKVIRDLLLINLILSSRLLIGAPQAADNRGRNLSDPGAVYRCTIEAENSCQELPFDSTGKFYNFLNQMIIACGLFESKNRTDS